MAPAGLRGAGVCTSDDLQGLGRCWSLAHTLSNSTLDDLRGTPRKHLSKKSHVNKTLNLVVENNKNVSLLLRRSVFRVLGVSMSLLRKPH